MSTRCQNTGAAGSRATPGLRALFYSHNCAPFYFCIYKRTRLANSAAIIARYLTFAFIRVIIEWGWLVTSITHLSLVWLLSRKGAAAEGCLGIP